MKNLTQIIVSLFIIFASCSKEYPTVSNENEISTTLNDQVTLNKAGKVDVVKVYRTQQSPVIDGEPDLEWSILPKNKVRHLFDKTGPIDNPRDLSAYFKMMWDDENLYLFVEVTDEELNVSSPNSWENDGIQIYIDGDYSKNTSDCLGGWDAYDENDYQLTAAFGQNPTCYPPRIDVSALNFAYQIKRKGFNIEAALPFDVILFSAIKGHSFGFEMQVNDNDLGVWQNVLLWTTTAGECTYLNPSLWGTAILVDEFVED